LEHTAPIYHNPAALARGNRSQACAPKLLTFRPEAKVFVPGAKEHILLGKHKTRANNVGVKAEKKAADKATKKKEKNKVRIKVLAEERKAKAKKYKDEIDAILAGLELGLAVKEETEVTEDEEEGEKE
jgi:hypothetical protein